MSASPSLPRRNLIAVTSASTFTSASLFNGKETAGVFISEALHPFQVFRAVGFEVEKLGEAVGGEDGGEFGGEIHPVGSLNEARAPQLFKCTIKMHYPTFLAIGVLVSHGVTSPLPLTPRSPSGFTSLIVFGDSFSDNGNGSYRISNGTVPANPAYYNHHFSNGPVWPEYLSTSLSTPLFDYAIGGATTSNALVQGYTGAAANIAVPSVLDQITSFLGNESYIGAPFTTDTTPDLAAPLFILLAGANDVLFDINITAAQSYGNMISGAEMLLGMYPQGKVLTIGIPDVSELPYGFYVKSAAEKAQLRSFSDGLASLLASSQVSSSSLPGSLAGKMANVDLRPLFRSFDYYAEPEMHGFDKLGKYGSCVVGEYYETDQKTVCGQEEADGRVYWDEYHPTTMTHGLIAESVGRVLGGPFGCDG